MKTFQRIRLLPLLMVVLIGGCSCSKRAYKHDKKCQLPDDLAEEIESYAPVVRVIANEAVNGSFRGVVWRELADFVDKFGSRLAGTSNLEDAIDYVLARSKAKNLDNVHGEVVKVPHWIRGKESATLWKPRKKDLAMLGLGYSVGTPREGILAKAIVVKSFAELQKKSQRGSRPHSRVQSEIRVLRQDRSIPISGGQRSREARRSRGPRPIRHARVHLLAPHRHDGLRGGLEKDPGGLHHGGGRGDAAAHGRSRRRIGDLAADGGQAVSRCRVEERRGRAAGQRRAREGGGGFRTRGQLGRGPGRHGRRRRGLHFMGRCGSVEGSWIETATYRQIDHVDGRGVRHDRRVSVRPSPQGQREQSAARDGVRHRYLQPVGSRGHRHLRRQVHPGKDPQPRPGHRPAGHPHTPGRSRHRGVGQFGRARRLPLEPERSLLLVSSHPGRHHVPGESPGAGQGHGAVRGGGLRRGGSQPRSAEARAHQDQHEELS